MKNEYGDTLDRNGYAPSILEEWDDRCFVCTVQESEYTPLIRHEIYQGVGRRETCKKLGLWITLCPNCHRKMHEEPSWTVARELDRYAQGCAQLRYKLSKQDFIRMFGKNYGD